MGARVLFLLASLAATAACADFPDLETESSAASRQAPYPVLLSVADIGALPAAGPDAEAATALVAARAAALRLRAAALLAPVIDSGEADRLKGALGRANP